MDAAYLENKRAQLLSLREQMLLATQDAQSDEQDVNVEASDQAN